MAIYRGNANRFVITDTNRITFDGPLASQILKESFQFNLTQTFELPYSMNSYITSFLVYVNSFGMTALNDAIRGKTVYYQIKLYVSDNVLILDRDIPLLISEDGIKIESYLLENGVFPLVANFRAEITIGFKNPLGDMVPIGDFGIGRGTLLSSHTLPKINSYTFKDINPTTLAITGNDNYIIANHSKVEMEITDYEFVREPRNSIGIAEFFCEVVTDNNVFSNDVTLTDPLRFYVSDISVSNESMNIIMYEKFTYPIGDENYSFVYPGVVETNIPREFYIPYFPPIFNTASFTRGGDVNQEVSLTVRATISTILVDNVEKNEFTHIYFRAQRNTHGAIWSNWEDVLMYAVIEGNELSIENLLLGSFDEAHTYNFEIRVDDKLSYSLLRATISPGEDAIILDPVRKDMKVNYDLSLYDSMSFTRMVQKEDELFLDIEYPDTRRLMKNFEYHLGYSKDPPEYWKKGQFYFQVQQLEEFSSDRFPQDFGTNHTWGGGYAGGRSYLESTDNAILKLMSANGYNPDHSAYPSNLIDGLLEWNDPYFEQFGENTPVEITWRWNGNVKLKEFRIRGWLQGHEPGSSPRTFYFLGSNDGNNWEEIYSTESYQWTDGIWSTWTEMEELVTYQFHKMVIYNNWVDMAHGIKFNQIEFKAEGEIEVN